MGVWTVINVTFLALCAVALGGATSDFAPSFQPCDQGLSCAPAACENGGIRIDSEEGYTCACPDGYTGATCSEVVEHSTNLGPTGPATGPAKALAQCDHDGCVEDLIENTNEFVLEHSTNLGPTGDEVVGQCDHDGCVADLIENTNKYTLSCNSEPCKHGGTCFDLNAGASFGCHCPPGFQGLLCEQTVLRPYITGEPETQLREGDPLMMHCKLDFGVPMDDVKMQWNTDANCSERHIQLQRTEDGMSYTVPTVTVADTGAYVCTATLYGRSVSSTVHVEVLPSPLLYQLMAQAREMSLKYICQNMSVNMILIIGVVMVFVLVLLIMMEVCCSSKQDNYALTGITVVPGGNNCIIMIDN